MEDKVICYYCGTVYGKQEEKCPLCGGKDVAKEDAYRPVQRQRITEQERRQRRRAAAKGGKYAANRKGTKKKETNGSTVKTMLVAALVFLSLAVVVVTWFIGDMIGWWGGFENTVDRDAQIETLELDSEECTLLELSHNQLTFDAVGQTAQIKLTVNASCRKEVSITFPSANVVTAVSDSPSEVQADRKTDTWVITAVAEGTTQMSFSCGEFSAMCNIVVGETKPTESTDSDADTETNPSEQTEDGDFEPKLNFEGDISLYQRGETVPLRVMNLPKGAKVAWKSSDITVAKIDDSGILTAVSGGKVTVTAEVLGKKVELLVRCPFDRSGDIGAHLEYEDVTINVGGSIDLYLLDSDGERITDVTYEVSEEGICQIEDGTVTGLVGGDYITVTVKYNTEEFKCIVRVRW